MLHSGRDFNEERRNRLQDLSVFIPHPKAPGPFDRLLFLPSFLLRNSFTRNVILQAAFIKKSLLDRGGHLHIPFLNVSYIRIPKSANTSLSSVVLQSIYPGLKTKELDPQEINFLTDVNLRHEISPEDATDIFFTVVRNPIARVVSVYRDFFQQTTQPFLYEDYLFGILTREVSFKEFINRLQVIPVWLMDQHLRPQHHFLDTYNKKKENTVIVLKLEKPGEVDSFLSIYGMHIPFLNRSPEPYDYRTYYDDATLQQVYRIYRKDIKLFGYEAEYLALEKSLRKEV